MYKIKSAVRARLKPDFQKKKNKITLHGDHPIYISSHASWMYEAYDAYPKPHPLYTF